jgi:protein TonB
MPVSKRAFALSMLIHTIVFAIGFLAMIMIDPHQPPPRTRLMPITERSITPPPKWLIAKAKPGSGGGGQRDVVPPSHGAIPTPRRIYTPPQVDPLPARLILPASIELPPDTPQSDLTRIGDPLSKSLFQSGGPGGPGGIGRGCCNSIGDTNGRSLGDGGNGAGFTSAVAAVAPVLIYSIEPEYTEEARKARYSGTVVLLAEIDETGRAVKMRVTRAVGMGLDERALEAVAKWRFRPGRGRDGKPVRTAATVEVNFRLL